MNARMEALADAVFNSVQGYVARAFGKATERLDAIAQQVAAIPAGAKGEPGDRGPQGELGPIGDPGRDGKDGVNGKDGANGIDGRDGRDGLDGKEGSPGRDAVDLEIRDGIDVERSYPRGTVAAHEGGLIRAMRTTEPIIDGDIVKAGWHVLLVGVKQLYVEVAGDGREYSMHAELTGGKKQQLKSWEMPVMIYREVFSAKRAEQDGYRVGDVVTWDGSLWHCQTAWTKDTPGTSPAWRMIVRKGNAGKDATPAKSVEAGPVRLK